MIKLLIIFSTGLILFSCNYNLKTKEGFDKSVQPEFNLVSKQVKQYPIGIDSIIELNIRDSIYTCDVYLEFLVPINKANSKMEQDKTFVAIVTCKKEKRKFLFDEFGYYLGEQR